VTIAIAFWLFLTAWWDHVAVIPDDNKIIVLRRGMSKGLNAVICAGGHFILSWITGTRLL